MEALGAEVNRLATSCYNHVLATCCSAEIVLTTCFSAVWS